MRKQCIHCGEILRDFFMIDVWQHMVNKHSKILTGIVQSLIPIIFKDAVITEEFLNANPDLCKKCHRTMCMHCQTCVFCSDHKEECPNTFEKLMAEIKEINRSEQTYEVLHCDIHCEEGNKAFPICDRAGHNTIHVSSDRCWYCHPELKDKSIRELSRNE